MSRPTTFSLVLLLYCSLSHSLTQFNTVTGRIPDDQQETTSWRFRKLSSVPEGLDVRLRELDLSNNVIRHINSQSLALPSLLRLDLSYNQLEIISEGAFRDVAQLQELNLARNALSHNVDSTSRALGSLHRLRRLDLSLNGLDDETAGLYLRDKSILERLDLTGNGLTRLTPKLFAESLSVRSIRIENNLITAIEEGTFEPLKKLKILNLARNNLVYICDFKLHQVKLLNLSRNSIEFFVTREDGHPYELEILDLSFNNLLYFPMVPKTNRLRYLHLQSNMVGTLETDTLISQADSLYRELTSGDEVNDAVDNNNIYSNWKLMPLVYMDLSSNHFRSLPVETLSHLTSLVTLNLSKNCLQDISYNTTKGSHVGGHHQPSLTFPSLRYFDLQNNGLRQLSTFFLEALPNIETLNLKENSVRPCDPKDQLGPSETTRVSLNRMSPCVSFWNIKTLTSLDLQDNGIKTLHQNTFEGTPLVSLNLASNVDILFDIGALEGLQSSLQSLSISGNSMTTSALSLPCLKALRRLNMSNNNVDVLPGIISCSPLTELDLRNNGLTSMNESVVDRLSLYLDVLYVSGNSFNCCDTNWLKALNKEKVNIPDLDHAVCLSVNGTLLTGLLPNHSLHCSLELSPKITEPNLGQIIIILLFVSTVLITLVVFVKKVCCNTGSLIV
ncbi:transforming growth factor beta activator LRRC32-like [Oncorhynchus nerka]|uniref:transforming growth factor beta activator LRRC32-like n=1 Tax=Oncorhynchus nerka TaxID=8023 RepID=UPI001131ECA0|nr:transforming growth factor beta activator LRRC32-like [Oncorhynchus nerka]XP_029501850.1 transforming growth factor beta activator LRRC32-like [Oncorhynchus nerka]XP_029510436.1 transforming growth factor beta activator LRRC32-like [Oncorhynchus nerka]